MRCSQRQLERRLLALGSEVKTVLVSHWPLVRQVTDPFDTRSSRAVRTTRTANWHKRFNAEVVVYGHLHIPRTTHYDGVRFEEVSLGYPREWTKRSRPPGVPKKVFPA